MATWLLKNRFRKITAQQFRTLIRDFHTAATNYYDDYKDPPILSIRSYTTQTNDLMPYYANSADDISDEDFAGMMNISVSLYRSKDIQNNHTAAPVGSMQISCQAQHMVALTLHREIDDHNALACPIKNSKGRGFLSSLKKLPGEPENILSNNVPIAKPILKL